VRRDGCSAAGAGEGIERGREGDRPRGISLKTAGSLGPAVITAGAVIIAT